MSASAISEIAHRGRPRSVEADAAIRQATLDLLVDDGFASLTMASVAHRAGVSTATLYRRWSSKVDLIVGVLTDRSGEIPVPDTGSLRGDVQGLLAHLLCKRSAAVEDDRLLAGLVSELARSPELADAVHQNLIEPRRHALVQMLERAEARGDCRTGLDHNLVIDLIFGPVHTRQLITGQPFTPRVAEALVDLVLRAVAPDRPQGAPS